MECSGMTFCSLQPPPPEFQQFSCLSLWNRLLLFLQARVQWHNLSSLQPPPLGLKPFSYVCRLSSWDYRTTGACHNTQLIFVFAVEMKFHHIESKRPRTLEKCCLRGAEGSSEPLNPNILVSQPGEGYSQERGIAGEEDFKP
ncbi:UPF0764 protein C16orf89 [Plecturocebus cupreus]